MSLGINFANKKRLCCDGLESVRQYTRGIETRANILTDNAVFTNTPISPAIVTEVTNKVNAAAALLKEAQELLN